MPSRLHQGLVDYLRREYDLNVGGFTKALRKQLNADDLADMSIIRTWRAIPDGYRIDADDRRVHVVEVVVDHPPSSDGLNNYAMLWFALDCISWDLVLTVVDRYGDAKEVNLRRLYYAFLSQARAGLSQSE